MRARAILESALDCIISTDGRGRIVDFNPAAERTFGYRRDEVVGRTVAETIIPAHLAEAHERGMARFLETGAGPILGRRVELPARHADGSEFPVELTVTGVDMEGGERFAVAYLRDITNRVARERTGEFLLALSGVTQPITDPGEIMQVTASMLGEHLQANRCAYAEIEEEDDHFHVIDDYTRDTFSIVGRLPASAFGERALRLMRENSPYVVNDIDTEAPSGMDLAAYHESEIRAVVSVPLHKAGRLVAGLAVHQKTPRVWSADEIELVRAVAHRCWESIERARVTRSLRDSEERLRLALDATQMGVWELDLATDRFSVDAGFRAIYGLRPEEEIAGLGGSLERVHPESRESIWKAFQTALDPLAADGSRHTLEYRILKPDGSERWVLTRGRVFFTGKDAARRPTYMIGTTVDITERKRLERELHHGAFHDPLTDLPNRALFIDRLEHVVAHSRRHSGGYALMVMDIDNFKQVNDSFGHPAGDRLLIEVARVLREHLRPNDTLARFGGDEFCVLVEEIESREHVLRVVARIQGALKRQPLFMHGRDEVHASISVGITFEGGGGRTSTAVIQDADLALYEAKRRGKGGYVIFERRLRAGPESPLRPWTTPFSKG